MPTYEYRCGACDTVSEINHRMSDPSPTDCPVCGKPQLSKQMSAAGFRLKGAGWYETDFKSDGKRNLAGDSGSAEGAKSDTKADSKPAGGGDATAAAPAKSETKSESKPAPAPAPKPASPSGGSASSP